MKIKMKASMRRLVAQGLDLLLKQTKAAVREAGKAYLSTQEGNIELGRIEFALEHLPASEAASEVWDVEPHILTVYKNALIMIGVEVQRTLAREKRLENEDAAKATREQLEEVAAQLLDLGEQYDFFAKDAEEEEDNQLEFAGAGKGGSDDED